MQFGIAIFATDYAIRPDELAREIEQRGFESLWLPEHTHIPANRRTPYPAGGDLPKEYWHTYDPFVALTAAAMVTTTLRVATGICLVIERDPITTAKEVASVDVLSGGRFIFGIGGGWNAEEMENHGTEYKKRWRLLRERVLAMKEIWTKDEAEFHGEFVNFDKLWSYPKPTQKPHPPILMGGDGQTTFDRVIEFCDGWMPIGFRMANLPEKIATLRQRAESAGRDPNTISISIFGANPERAALEQLEGLGVERAIFFVPPAERDVVMPLVDKYSVFIS
ncbi:MAG TPA: LLM class F420-dependent oxidoreductase [Blastocatellia bacterium]|nr:LLM class F420-dependent oxidoreductase [Blastocatellia bacterium]